MSSHVSVIAIIAAHNEEDVIDQVIGDLVEQGVQVYFLDDHSTDRTVAVVERHLNRGVLHIEHLSETLKTRPDRFEWGRILDRKAELASQLNADWFIHHDADEFRESPWTGESLRDAIGRVDRLGYNAIDFEVFDFWPVTTECAEPNDVRRALPCYSPGASCNRLQVRCWKKTDRIVDLASSGGHDVTFDDRHVFPVRFVLRHYPIRNEAHGVRKVLHERKARYLAAEKALGWHVQYDGVHGGEAFVRSPDELTRYDGTDVRVALTLRHRGVEALEATLAEAQRDAGTLRSNVSALLLALTHAQSRAEQAETALANVHEAHLRARGDLRAAVGRAHDAEQRLADLVTSRSWRWMAPMRAIYRALTGAGPAL